MHKFCRREIRFVGTCSASFSYELRARKLLNRFKLEGSKRPDVTLLFAADRCEYSSIQITGRYEGPFLGLKFAIWAILCVKIFWWTFTRAKRVWQDFLLVMPVIHTSDLLISCQRTTSLSFTSSEQFFFSADKKTFFWGGGKEIWPHPVPTSTPAGV